MKMRQLRKLAIGIISLLMFSSQELIAADRDDRVSELEDQMEQVGTENSMGTFGANTASARPNVDGRGVLVTFDLLYWRAKVGGTEYAYSDSDNIISYPIKGIQKHINFSRDWGMRVGLGYNFDYDDWTIRGQYTYWDTTGSNSIAAGQSNSIVPMRGSSFITDDITTSSTTEAPFIYCTSAKSYFTVDYQAIDIELGRDYYTSSKLSLCPHWGIKSAKIGLRQKTRYTGGETKTSGTNIIHGLSGNTVYIKETSDFIGIGPRTGLDSRWYLGEGISLFGNISGALVWGYFDVEHKENYSLYENSNINIKADRNAFSPTVQYQLGLRYDTYMHHDIHHLSLGIAFEGEYWWRQNQMLKINDAIEFKYDRYSDDLTFYGLTADIKWEF